MDTMKDTSLFQHILEDMNAGNVREKLFVLEADPAVRRQPLCTPVTDTAYFSGNEILLVLCDFLTYPEQESWLADEERVGKEIPLYFSESSHRQSPVFKLRRARAFFSRFFPEPAYRIRLLLLCNYSIINYEDMLEVWEQLDVHVVQQLANHPPVFPDPRNGEKELEDKGESVSVEDDAEDEFDRLLNEFIAKELRNPSSEEEEKSEEVEEEDDDTDEAETDGEAEEKEADEEPYRLLVPASECFRVCEMDLFRQQSGPDADDDEEERMLAFNIRDLDRIAVNILVHYKLDRKPVGHFFFFLYNETGQLLEHGRLQDRFVAQDYGMNVYLWAAIGLTDGRVWKKGKYLLEIRFGKDTLVLKTFSVGPKDLPGRLVGETDDDASTPSLRKLERMAGLRQVKEQMTRYHQVLQLACKRKSRGLQATMPSLHAMFTGNPGTGKTTVARLYGGILKELGLLSRGHVVRVDRSNLVGTTYGSEEEKTREAIERARGGVLFIDEAYTLYTPDSSRDPGRNVLQVLLTAIEDDPGHDYAVLLAGYSNEMAAMLSSNPGLQSRIPQQNRYHFEDYTVDELLQIADSYCEENNYVLTAEARKALRCKVVHDYSRRDATFGNGRYVVKMFMDEIIPAMSLRTGRIKRPSLLQLMMVEKEDIPALRTKNYEKSIRKLHEMVGLTRLKQSIESHLNMVKVSMLRNEQGISTSLPPLHMVFAGNPGTGKTTVADLIGEVYASLGLLSVGRVIRVERKDLVGSYIGETEKKTAEVLKQAQGNVLFIDEAYTLTNSGKDDKDFGRRALEVLLNPLGNEHIDMLVIMACYPEEVDRLFQSNPGLKSRIPYAFYFEDYSVDELMVIAKSVAGKMNYRFTPAALKALRLLVEEKMARRDGQWGNARFITRIISNTIIPAMSARLLKLPPSRLADKKALLTICRADIPDPGTDADTHSPEEFDEAAIRRALKKLDGMVGLDQVKQNIHNFVEVARYLQRTGRSYADCGSLRWNFTGHTGTGKSTVAGIMGELLRAMHILEKGHLVEVKAEEFYSASEYKADEILRTAMSRSCQGVLFIDGDSPLFGRPDSRFNSDSLRFKLGSMMAELPGAYALVIAEHESSSHALPRSLRTTGVSEFDHTFYFADYTGEELCQILVQCLKLRKLRLSEKAGAFVNRYINGLCSRRELGYANARTMKLIADAVAEACWLRAGVKGGGVECEVLYEDVKGFVWTDLPGKQRIGYK